MAHFAELDANNIVQQVIVVNNNDTQVDGVENESKGITFCKTLLGQGKLWVQTSYNGNIRKQFAGAGYFYDSIKDKFIGTQPFPSWVLDANDDWQSPIAKPSDASPDNPHRWDEVAGIWVKV